MKSTLQDMEYGRKLKNMDKETQTVYDLEYGEKPLKTWKMTNAHCRNQNMARN